MKIGIIGAGNIGGNAAALLAKAGHDIVVSFSRDDAGLRALAERIGTRAGTPAEAAAHGEVVMLAVPWGLVDVALEQAGDLAGRIVIDTTNQFGQTGAVFTVLDLNGVSASAHNAAKAPKAQWVKAFNTLTAGFQASSAGRTGSDRVVMFYATEHDEATATVEALINDAGFDAVRTGGFDRTEVGHQEPKGDLYGEEFHHDEAVALVSKLRGAPPSGRGRP
jgi:hypothetical protein